MKYWAIGFTYTVTCISLASLLVHQSWVSLGAFVATMATLAWRWHQDPPDKIASAAELQTAIETLSKHVKENKEQLNTIKIKFGLAKASNLRTLHGS